MTASLEVLAAPVVNHAMAHNGLRFVHRIVLAAGSEPIADATLVARLVDPQGEQLLRPWRHQAGALEPGAVVTLDRAGIELDPVRAAALADTTSADLVVEALDGDRPIATTRTPVRVLAARHWLLDPHAPVLSLELLAAFVQPNHPALAGLVPQVARELEARTRSGSLAVSHVGPERVDQIVEAAATVVHDLGIYYAEPPASWGYGQQVRSPGDVLEQRVGTCLDTTVLLASLLEHLGIHPVVWVALGHAFLGWWRSPDHGLPDAASLQTAPAVNAVGLGLMGVLETTMLTRERRPPKYLFRRAAQAPKDSYLHTGGAELVGVVDVQMARLMRVLPVPARTRLADGTVQVVEYHPATQPYAAPAPAGAPSPPGTPGSVPPVASGTAAGGIPEPAAPTPPPRVQAWKNALLDLTLRNRLLAFGHGVTQLPLLMPGEQLGLLADLLQDGAPVSLRAVDDLATAVAGQGAKDAYALPADIQRTLLRDRSTVHTAADAETHKALVARLRYRARTGLQETGANPLVVTLGRLDWRLGDRDLSAPLLLAPVEIKGIIQPYKVVFDDTGEITVNLSLLEKLRLEFGFTVPGLTPLPTRAGGEGVDVEAVIRLVREAIVAAGLPFTVVTEARLAIVGFTGYLLWRDLDEHWQRFLERPVARHLALSPTERLVDPAAGEVDGSVAALDDIVAAVPIPADASQAEAIAAARAGRTFVLEGPPGTGKSQTITNILADQLAQGRRVLFVAEKGAALDVVRNRLAEVGLLPFALDLHDEHARPAQVRERLRAALAQLPRADLEGQRAAAADATSSARALDSYAARLHERNAAGLSLWSARSQALARGAGPELEVPIAAVSQAGADADAARAAIVSAVGALAGLGPDTAAAWGLATTVPADLAGLPALVAAADAAVAIADERVAAAPEPLQAAVAAAGDPDELARVATLLAQQAVPMTALLEVRTDRWQAARAELDARTRDLLAGRGAQVQRHFGPDVVTVRIEPVREALEQARASFFIGRKGRMKAAMAPLLAHALPGQRLDPDHFSAYVEQLASLKGHLGGLVGAWSQLPGVSGIDVRQTILLTEAGRADLARALARIDEYAALLDGLSPRAAQAVQSARLAGWALFDEAVAAVDEAARALTAVAGAVGARPDTTARWAGDQGLLRAWEAGQPTRLADLPTAPRLRRWAEAAQALEPLAAAYPTARWQLLTGAVEASEATAAFDRGLARAALTERLDATALGTFDSASHERVVDRFVDASTRLRATLRGTIPAAVIAGRPFHAGALFGKVAAFEREVSRTRGGLSVRGLVAAYGEVIAELTPCLLVSPDSLARFVPPGAIDFDLVVFDEASQITVADAIGALGRAKAAVVAGDSKQLPPTSFGELGAAEEASGADGDATDFTVVPDEESILSELVHAGVDRLWLSWHYRSRDEALIAFSNRHYYEDRLSSFPAVPGQVHDTGLSWVRVDGTFHRSGEGGLLRTNPVEAAAVVQEVLRRWAAGERSIGVVTFNLQQRTLIERMLMDSGIQSVQDSLTRGKDGLFVKNLENVQGDERDVILFSTGFAKNKAGVLPLNFGPLNRAGGERRLNVAVTRARRRVVVYSSFDPEDLRVEQTSSVGIRHLRAYLELARAATQSGSTDVGMPPASAPETTGSSTSSGSSASGGSERVVTEVIDRHRDEIAAALRGVGLEVRTAVGLSDFKVDLAVGPAGRPACVAVLLDGPTWAGRRTTSDRDGLPITVLHDVMGWPAVLRVWLPDWLRDPARVVREVAEATERAAVTPRHTGERVVSTGHAAPPPPQDSPTPQDSPATPQDSPSGPSHAEWTTSSAAEPPPADADPVPSMPPMPGAERWAPAPTPSRGSRGVLDSITSPRSAQRVQQVMREHVHAEGPLSVGRLALLTVRSFGLTRLPATRIPPLRQLVPRELRRDPEEGFVWPEHLDPLRWQGFRVGAADLKDRPLDEIPLRELGNAMAAITATAMGIGVEDLLKETLRVFAGSRLTDAARTRLTAALQVAEQRGQVIVTGGVVRPATP